MDKHLVQTNKLCQCEFPEESSSSCSSTTLHLKKRTKRVTTSTEKTVIRSMGESSSMKFLELLAEVCRGDEKSIGLPTDPQFWSLFAEKFSQILEGYWSPDWCEKFATTLGMQYLNKDRYKDRFSGNFKSLLEQVFVQKAHLLLAFAATQKDPDVVLETPPGKLVKRPEGSTSLVRNISQSEGSSLPEELEAAVRNTILSMSRMGMLTTIQQIEFAQNNLTRSTWAARAFLEKPDLESKLEFIDKSMYAPEVWEKNKNKKRLCGLLQHDLLGS